MPLSDQKLKLGESAAVCSRPTRAEQEADVCARHEPCADAGFHVIADHRAEKLPAGGDFTRRLRRIGPRNFAVGAFEIGGGRACAEIDPFADIAVAQKTVVGFVGVTEHDRVDDFAADLAEPADGGGVFDDRKRANLRVRSRCKAEPWITLLAADLHAPSASTTGPSEASM